MMQRLLVALVTIAVFVAGYGSRMLVERDHPVPPLPAALASEFAPPVPATANARKAIDRAKLVADIEKLRPQIEAYRNQIEEIYAESDRELALILNAEQREKQREIQISTQKERAERAAKRKADPTPLSDDEIARSREGSLRGVYYMVTVTGHLERMTKTYHLDAAQQVQVRALLAMRRQKFLALLDGTPHPSISLSQLAPVIERLAAPAAP